MPEGAVGAKWAGDWKFDLILENVVSRVEARILHGRNAAGLKPELPEMRAPRPSASDRRIRALLRMPRDTGPVAAMKWFDSSRGSWRPREPAIRVVTGGFFETVSESVPRTWRICDLRLKRANKRLRAIFHGIVLRDDERIADLEGIEGRDPLRDKIWLLPRQAPSGTLNVDVLWFGFRETIRASSEERVESLFTRFPMWEPGGLSPRDSSS
jgi:hypothetical protein